jgi:hypothetical protein
MNSRQPSAFVADDLLTALDDFPTAAETVRWRAELGTDDPAAASEPHWLDVAIDGGTLDPLLAIQAVIEALRKRHADDRATLTALSALQHQYLPQALDAARGPTLLSYR